MSTVTYRYEQSYSFKKKGVKHTIREQIIDGQKGLSIKFLKKVGDDFYRIYAVEKEGDKDKIILKEKMGEKETEKEVTQKDLLKILKAEKLDSMIEYINKNRGSYKNRNITIKNKLKDLLAI